MVRMAHCTGVPFFLFLSLLLFVSFSRFPPAASSAGVPVSVSAKAAAVQYWNRVAGSDSRPPPVLLAHVSGGDFKSLDSIRMVTAGGSEGNQAISDAPADAEMRRAAGGEAKENHQHHHHGGSADNQASADEESQGVPDNVEMEMFFRESRLKKGRSATMNIAGYGGEIPHQDFLPRSVASRIPLSADAILRLFHIPADAPMGKSVATTIELCGEAPVEGETRRCITSAEDMIDYVVSSLGAKSSITARTPSNASGVGGTVLMGEVTAANGGELSRVVACHRARFPYLLYRCHNVPKTRLYEVEMLDPGTKAKISLAPAICHYQASAWTASEAERAALGKVHGTEFCHWVSTNDMVWIAAAE